MAVGMLTYLAIGVDSGVSATPLTGAYSSAAVDYVPFSSETMDVTKADLVDDSLVGQWDEEKMHNGIQRVQGSIAGIASPRALGYILRPFFDQCAATGIAIPAHGGATSHSAVRAHVFTTKNTQFHAGSGSDLPTVTMELYRGPIMATAAAVGSSFVYYNVAGNRLNLQLNAGELLRFSGDFVGREYGGKPNIAPPTPNDPLLIPDAWLWSQASLSVFGAATTIYQGINFTLENNLQGIPKLDGRLRDDLIKRTDFRRVNFGGSISFQSTVDYDRFQSGTEGAIVLTVKNATACSASHFNTLIVELPNARYQSHPINATGPGPITVAVAGRGMFSQTSAYAMQVTVINSRTSAYVLNAAA